MRYLCQPSWIFAFCAFPAKKLQVCPPRLCSWISVEMISIGQPFTAGHVCFHEKWWFGSLGTQQDPQNNTNFDVNTQQCKCNVRLY